MDLTPEQQDRLTYILCYRLGYGSRVIAKALGMKRHAVERTLCRMAGTTRSRVELDRALQSYDRFCRPLRLSTGGSGLSRADKALPVDEAQPRPRIISETARFAHLESC